MSGSHFVFDDLDNMSVATLDDATDPSGSDDLCWRSRLLSVRETLTADGAWAASAGLPQRLCWISDHRRHRLVWRHDWYDARLRFAFPKTIVKNAELVMLAFLTDDDCRLALPDFSGVRLPYLLTTELGCRLTAVEPPLLAIDFERTCANIEQICSDPTVRDAKRSSVLIVDDGITKLRVRHIPFVVRCDSRRLACTY